MGNIHFRTYNSPFHSINWCLTLLIKRAYIFSWHLRDLRRDRNNWIRTQRPDNCSITDDGSLQYTSIQCVDLEWSAYREGDPLLLSQDYTTRHVVIYSFHSFLVLPTTTTTTTSTCLPIYLFVVLIIYFSNSFKSHFGCWIINYNYLLSTGNIVL